MTTLTNPQIQHCAVNVKNGWGNLIEFAHDLAAINKQRTNLIKLRHQIGIESKSLRDVGMTQFDLIWAYSSQFAVNSSE